MGPRVKKPRSGKAKDLPTSAEAEREIVEGGDEKVHEETDLHEDVHKTEVDNGGEAPPLKKVRGRQNVRKVPAKSKGTSAAAADEENTDEGAGKLSDDTGAEENANKVTSDYDDEEAAPAKKGRGRTKKVTKDDVVGKDVSNGEEELKEDLDGAVAVAKKGRPRKKKVEGDEPEVMPKKKDRGAKRIETIAEEEAATSEDKVANEPEGLKQKISKREKKQPAKRAGKSKKDQDDEEKLVEDEEISEKKEENGQALEDQAEDFDQLMDEGAGDAKPVKKTARGKAAAKAVDEAAKKKPAGRGKKATKGEELSEDNDVPVDGKKLRVLVEHW